MPLALQNLGCYVVGRATNGLLLFTVVLEFGGQSEITELNFHIFVEEEVAQFEIPVNDLVLVQVPQGVDDLRQVALHFDFGEALPSLDQLVEGLGKA
jgi:hypothetical protein